MVFLGYDFLHHAPCEEEGHWNRTVLDLKGEVMME